MALTFDDPRIPSSFWSKVIPEPMSGCWLWLASIMKNGYGRFLVPRIRAKTYRRAPDRAPPSEVVNAHRFMFETLFGELPQSIDVDHRCRTKCCVNPDHLRAATKPQNGAHQGLRSDNTSGYKGVHFAAHRSKWQARIRIGSRRLVLGYFDTAEAAARVYDAAATEHHREFALLNFAKE